MNQWEDIIDNYVVPPDNTYFAKLLQTGRVVLKEDLANFEIEWIIETLLSKPVNLLLTISEKRNENLWSKTNENSFKLLTEILTIHHEYVTRYHEDIVKLCLLNYDAETRKSAITCLTALVKHFPYNAVHVRRHIDALENSTTCRAPLALLVGTICKYHPELVAEDFNTIWRIYLNMLDGNKNTNTITSAVLQGIHDLFEYYGTDLQTMELSTFYDKMTREFLQKSKCDNVCHSILENHSGLFREKLSKDTAILNYLWTKLSQAPDGLSTKCVLNVYEEVLKIVSSDRQALQKIITTLLPHTQSTHGTVKYASTIILHNIKRQNTAVSIDLEYPNVQVLEFELPCRAVSYNTAYEIQFCIEASLPNSDKLLQTAVLFYENLPAPRRKEIVVDNIMKASEELRTSTINFLITETSQDELSLEKHSSLWNDLFTHERAGLIFDDIMTYTIFVLQQLDQEQSEILSPQVSHLLTLIAHLLSTHGSDSRSHERCVCLAGVLRDRVSAMCAAKVWRQLALIIDEEVPYQDFDIERCTEEQTLCDYCLIIMNAPLKYTGVKNVLTAFQIIFSRNDVEPTTLSVALKKFETILNMEKDYLDKNLIAEIVRSIEKLSARKDLTGKDARVLHRDVVMFLGKYGKSTFMKESNNSLNKLVMKLKDELTLNVPNPIEGTNYKISLHQILRLALIHENAEALQVLATIIYANLSPNSSETLEQALCEVTIQICRNISFGYSNATLPQTPFSASCVQRLATHLKTEKSPGVRKLVCGIIEESLTRNPGSDENDELVMTIIEQAEIMLNSLLITTQRAGLDLKQTLIVALKKNNLLTRRLLPDIIINLSKTKENDSNIYFEEASKSFIEKIDLFDDKIDALTETLLTELLQNGGRNKMADPTVLKVYRKSVKMVLEFVKNVFEITKREKKDLLEKYFDIIGKLKIDDATNLYVLSGLRNVFDLDADLCRYVVTKNDGFVMEKLFCMGINDAFCMEVVFRCMEQYCDVLLEFQYEKTIKHLSNINHITPINIIRFERIFKSCLTKYATKYRQTPRLLLKSVENWCNNLKIFEITKALEKDCYTSEHALIVHSLKIMVDTVNVTDMSLLTDVKNETRKWPRILLKSFANGYLARMTSKLTYLSDLLSVSVKLSKSEVKNIMLEGHNLHGVPNERIGLKFVRFFMHVFFEYLIEPPCIMLDADLATCCMLLNDIVKYALKKKCTDIQYEYVLELVDKLWPTYEPVSSFSEKYTMLLDLTGLPKCLHRDSNPILWACGVIQLDGAREDKARLLSVLPGGMEYNPTYHAFASTLPCRLSELTSETGASLRALLDALSTNANPTLLNIVMALAAGDDTKGWWDEAIVTCMASVATKAGPDVYKAVYARCWGGASTGVCNRVLVPLLRYSSSQKCEEFFSSILSNLISRLKRGISEGASENDLLKYVIDYTKALVIMNTAFEKLPRTSIESPSSTLYKNIEPTVDTSYWLVRTACKQSYTLTSVVGGRSPSGDHVKEACRVFHCVNFNCMATALCLIKAPSEKFSHVLGDDKWHRLVDCTRLYNLPLVSKWNRRTRAQPSPMVVESRSSSLLTATQTRTRLFLRTLSECVLQYDLHAQEIQEDVVNQELLLTETELNQHECATTLTSLLCHLSTLNSDWPEKLASALEGQCHRNVKFLLAQIICNAREELKPQASTLRPALFAMISATVDERSLLNGLHIDVLETIIFWSDDNPESSSNLNATTSCLLATCLENRQRPSIYKMILDVVDRFLNLYGKVVKVEWSVFERYVSETTADAKVLEILKHVTKYNVYIQELLPAVLDKLPNKNFPLIALAELFGLALACCKTAKSETANSSTVNSSTANSSTAYISTANRAIDNALTKFRQVLESKRSQGADYVKMLYYAQMKYSGCCDEARCRVITDLTLKMPAEEKKKCLKILSSYFSNYPPVKDYIEELFESITICDLIMSEQCVEAFYVVKEGLFALNDVRRKTLVMQVANYCQHSVVQVRKAAYEVMLQAFKGSFPQLYSRHTSHAIAIKKSRTTITSRIIQATESKDNPSYGTADAILKSISLGVSDANEDIRANIIKTVSEYLCEQNMAIRFIEAFILCIYTPITARCTNNMEPSVCLSALFEMLFSDLRKHERFQRAKLREEPISTRESSMSASKLLTTSRTCVGTFRTTALTKKRYSSVRAEDTPKPDIDVQITIDSILEKLLQFMKQLPDASYPFCTELTSNLATDSPEFDCRPTLAKLLCKALENGPCELTPVVLVLIDSCVDTVGKQHGILTKLEQLRSLTLNSEASFHLELLCKEVQLINTTCDQSLYEFKEAEEEIQDSEMEGDFCIDDLKSIFGKLSNWDDLTIQQRRNVLNAGLPPLWTDTRTLIASLNEYIDTQGWFSKMVSAYKQEDRQNSIKWLREVDKWPRRRFDISATTEAIEYFQSYEHTQTYFNSDIQPSDCLAEWSARFMIRTAYLNSLESNDASDLQKLSRSYELKWCERANEMKLSKHVLDCVKRNTEDDLYKSELLAWLCQKVEASRITGLQQNDDGILERALTAAEQFASEFIKDSTLENIVKINLLTLQLQKDLQRSSKDNIQNAFSIIKEYSSEDDFVKTEKYKGMVWKICGLALSFYGDITTIDTSSPDEIIMEMTKILEHSVESNVPNSHLILCLILDTMTKIRGNVLSSQTARKLLDTVKTIHPNLNTFILESLRSHSELFSSLSLLEYPFMSERDTSELVKYKKCFQLVADAEHVLVQFCEDLYNALGKNDANEWKAVFDRMKSKIFENEYAGMDYQLLNKYKEKLYGIYQFDPTPTYKTHAEAILREIVTLRPSHPTLRLKQLCPALVQGVGSEAVSRLLSLPPAVHVASFHHQVSVFTDSKRRPCLIKARLTNGLTKRYLIKHGECLRTDAAAVSLCRDFNALTGARCTTYQITPLSEDCGLIEFLENHERLRSVISASTDIDSLAALANRPADDELILAPLPALLRHYAALREGLPISSLHSAVKRDSASVQQYCGSVGVFTDSVSACTLIGWLLGLGDRHLQNILYSTEDSSVCLVDWNALFQYGVGEIPPARLTPNILAVCSVQVLESRLQSLLTSLRDSHKIFLAATKITFQWMGSQFDDKFPYIQAILTGESRCYDITRDAIGKSQMKFKNKYNEFLDKVFEGWPQKESYSVEEQVSCLLHQCTDNRILAVTRSGWEPWI